MSHKKPLVVAVPRSGFSLLIQVLGSIQAAHGGPPARSVRERLMVGCVEWAGPYCTRQLTHAISRHGVADDLIYNGEFHVLTGGPKWCDPKRPERACIRKYVGIRGQGDVLLITSHPAQVLSWDNVIHSHVAPGVWPDHPLFADHLHGTSIRNPVGIVNSACFSLNAMASEYVQRFLPHADEDNLRQRMALYKLTDLDFVRGIASFLKKYLQDYLPVRDRYHTMRWEELITQPAATIRRVARWLDISLTDEQALAIWKPLDHVNTLQFHQHNFRRGKGIVGDWKNSLVREHLDLFRELDFEPLLEALGYPPLPELNPRDYSPYQQLIARHLQRGEVFRAVGDADLFGFAFNKSNIDASKFGFKAFAPREHTHIERSTVRDERIVETISDTAEQSCGDVNRALTEILTSPLESAREVQAVADSVLSQWESLTAGWPNGEALTFQKRKQAQWPKLVRELCKAVAADETAARAA